MRLNIDRISYREKPDKSDNRTFGGIKARLGRPEARGDYTMSELKTAICRGQSWTPCELSGTKASDFVSEQVFAVDIDNEQCLAEKPVYRADGRPVTVERVLTILGRAGIRPALIYHSFSSSKELPRLRVLVQTDNPVTEPGTAEEMRKKLIALFNAAEPGCADESGANADRMFLGARADCVAYEFPATTPAEMILAIKATPRASKPQAQQAQQTAQQVPQAQQAEKKPYTRDLRPLLKYITIKNRDEWINIGLILKHEGYTVEDFDSWSATQYAYQGFDDCQRTWDGLEPDGRITGGSLVKMAMDGGWRPSDDREADWQRLATEAEAMAATASAPQQCRAVCDNGKARPIKEFKPVEMFSASQLQQMKIPDVDWIIQDILPVGLAVLVAPPKSGKSYMALQFAYEIATGGKFLGFQCKKCSAVHCDLESTKRRPKARLRQMFGDAKMPDNLYFVVDDAGIGKIGNGLEQQLEALLARDPNIKLIILDVFQKIRPAVGRSSANAYEREYGEITPLKVFAEQHDISLVLVHHSRKMRDPGDYFNNASGSTAITGSVDVVWSIAKENRKDRVATLNISGKDVIPRELVIESDGQTCLWTSRGDFDSVAEYEARQAYEHSPIVNTVRKLLAQNSGDWEGTASELKAASRYFGRDCQINEEPNKIAKAINDFSRWFEADWIAVDRDTKRREGSKKVERLLHFYEINPFAGESTEDSAEEGPDTSAEGVLELPAKPAETEEPIDMQKQKVS